MTATIERGNYHLLDRQEDEEAEDEEAARGGKKRAKSGGGGVMAEGVALAKHDEAEALRTAADATVRANS